MRAAQSDAMASDGALFIREDALACAFTLYESLKRKTTRTTYATNPMAMSTWAPEIFWISWRASLFGIPIDGYHDFIGAEARFRIRVLSLFQVVDGRGPIMNQSETVTARVYCRQPQRRAPRTAAPVTPMTHPLHAWRLSRRTLTASLLAVTFSLVCALVFARPAMAQKSADLARLVPAAVEGWTQSGPDRTWTPDTLHRYINGGAELYISYGFTRAFSRRFVRAGRPAETLTVDVFEMGSPAKAYGLFAHSREKPTDEVGQGSEYGGGLLHFWKGRYYVSLLGQPDTPDLKRQLTTLGRTIAAVIRETGTPPAIVGTLPPAGLRPNTVRYVTHPVWLNSHVFISDENILHLAADTEAALARYRRDGRDAVLLVVVYPSETRAERARADFLAGYVGAAPGGTGTGKDGKWAGCGRRGSRLAAVVAAADADLVTRLLAEALDGFR